MAEVGSYKGKEEDGWESRVKMGVTKAKMDSSLKPARLARAACSADRHPGMD